MTLKSSSLIALEPNEAWGYPCLGIIKNSSVCTSSSNKGLIVLFISHGYGVVVDKASSCFRIGEIRSNWDMDVFRNFYGSVTIIMDR